MKKRPIYLLSLGHLVTDLNQGAIPAMLPFLVAELDLTYASRFLVMPPTVFQKSGFCRWHCFLQA
jgi:hypothetical protein